MIYRQLAWINALRIQLRQPTSFSLRENKSVEALFDKHGERDPACEVVEPFLDGAEVEGLRNRKNVATHLVKNQGKDIDLLLQGGKITEFDKQILHGTLEELYNLQGRCERIKNTPFPRQYAYFSTVFCWIFILLVPFGLLDVFSREIEEIALNEQLLFASLMIPFSVLISWIFTTVKILLRVV